METLRKNQGIYIAEGILFLILGTLAIVLPHINTAITAPAVGLLLAIGGLYRFFRNLRVKNDIKHYNFSVITSAVAFLVGLYLLSNPISKLILMAILLGTMFLIEGFNSVYQSISMRTTVKHWNMILFSGIVSFIFAALIITVLPYTSLGIIGLLVGVNMIVYGYSTVIATASTGQFIHKLES